MTTDHTSTITQFAQTNADAIRAVWGKDGTALLDVFSKVLGLTHADLPSDEFNAFWQAYPATKRKVDKRGCWGIWKREKMDKDIDKVLQVLTMHKADDEWVKNRGDFVPMPSVYLRQRRWDIDLGTPDFFKGGI